MATIYLPLNSREKFDLDVTRTYSCAALKFAKSPNDGNCVIHAVLCCMRCIAVKAMSSTIELLNLVKFEVLNNIEYYGGFLNFTETNFVEELDPHIATNQYSSGTIDVVLSAFGNALRCRIILLKKRENDYYVECNDHVINPTRELITPNFTIKLHWAGEHYYALVEVPSFTGIYWVSSKFCITYFLTKHGLYPKHGKRHR